MPWDSLQVIWFGVESSKVKVTSAGSLNAFSHTIVRNIKVKKPSI